MTEKRDGASRVARPVSCEVKSRPGGEVSTRSGRGRLVADDDGVALVAAGVDIAEGDGPAVGLCGGHPPIAGGRIAPVADNPAAATHRDVAVATVRTGDRGATIGAEVDRGLVADRAAIDRHGATVRVADHDRVAAVATGVDVADAHRPAIGLRGGHATIARRRVAPAADDPAA